MESIATSHHRDQGRARQPGAHPRVVQQLMFNRILSYVRLLSVDGVTVSGFDAKTSTLACTLAGVSVSIRVTLEDAEPPPVAVP
jgi:hypothetical protein